MLAQYKSEGDHELVYQAALRLSELEPENATAYIDAAEALLQITKVNYDEINRLMALGCERAKGDARSIVEWAESNQPSLSIQVPFVPDYTSVEEINTEGTTTGNLTNAAKYGGEWRGGLLTWQGDWVYLARPDEKFAMYKLRADGSGYQRLGKDCGSSLNVIGDWLYYVNISDGGKPYKMRTDGSMRTKISNDCCGFLSVSGDWIYYDGDGIYKIRTDGSQRTKLNHETSIFSCVSGEWVYYQPKSVDGGLWRLPVGGGKPRRVAKGFIQTYCVVDDWVYFVDFNKRNGIQRVHTDGTGLQMLVPLDSPITTLNVINGTIVFSFNVLQEEDGFLISREIVMLDIVSLEKKLHIDADTEPICGGPGGWVYFLKYADGLAWYAVDQKGIIRKIE